MGDRNRQVDSKAHHSSSSSQQQGAAGAYYPTLGKAHNARTAEDEDEDVGDDEASAEAMIVPDSQQVAAELDRAAALLRKPDSDTPVRAAMSEQRSSQTLEAGGGAGEGGGEEGDKDELGVVSLADPGIAGGKPEGRVYRQGVWSLNESIVLLDAKKREREILQGSKRNSISADEKWKAVAEFCWSHGVHRSKEQCRFKWENTMPDFKKVRDYEYEKGESDKSYFELENWQRKEKHLPPNLSRELYNIMDSFHAGGTSRRTASSVKKEVRDKAAAAAAGARLGVSAALVDGAGDLTQESVATESGVEPQGLDRHTPAAPPPLPPAAAAAAAAAAVEVKQAAEDKAATREAAETARLGRRKRRRLADSSSKLEDSTLPQHAADVAAAVDMAGASRGGGDEAATATTATTTGAAGMKVEGSTQGSAGQRDSTQGDAARDSLDTGAKMAATGEGVDDSAAAAAAAAVAATPPPAKEARVAGAWSAEDRKEARHRELVALEREKLVANKEAMGLVATALNNVATAVVRMADMLHQR